MNSKFEKRWPAKLKEVLIKVVTGSGQPSQGPGFGAFSIKFLENEFTTLMENIIKTMGKILVVLIQHQDYNLE